MTTNGLPDANDIPADIRDSVAVAAAGALCNPDQVIGDWGEYDSDHPNSTDCENDPHGFYETTVAIDVRITDDDETNTIMEAYDAQRYGDSD
jgi:hypothetical protein